MVQFREANKKDIEKIAMLHAESWRKHYRGIWKDAFLDKDVYKERMDAWKRRLSHPKTNQYVLLAEKDNVLYGFACIYFNDDPVFGSLLDNLHVSGKVQGLGIGTQLMNRVFKIIKARTSSTTFYLWVLEANNNARKFYEHLGGRYHETVMASEPDGGCYNVQVCVVVCFQNDKSCCKNSGRSNKEIQGGTLHLIEE